MRLGLFLRGALTFMHTGVGGAIRDRSARLGVDALVSTCHRFRLGAFRVAATVAACLASEHAFVGETFARATRSGKLGRPATAPVTP